MFVVAGENDFIVPAGWVQNAVYVPATVPSILGILSGATHFDALGDADGFRGYVTAWFAFCLRGSPVAAPAFVGGCSLCDNPDWEVRRKPGVFGLGR